jgi:uncharacterized RDD family membrane protein YckC
MNSPYAPPKARVSDVETLPTEVTYGGFWRRVGAAIIDSLIVMAITVPLLLWIYGSEYFFNEEVVFISGPAEFLISYVFPIVATVLFWKYRAATPGKMLLQLKIVRAGDFGPITTGQAFGRYFAYIPSTLVFGLGLLWVAFDARKQGWHDKLAGTVVIHG